MLRTCARVRLLPSPLPLRAQVRPSFSSCGRAKEPRLWPSRGHSLGALGSALPTANAAGALQPSRVTAPVPARALSSEAQAPAQGSAVPEAPPVHPFFLEVLRGLGQVVFCEHLLSGGCIGAALFLEDVRLGGLAVLGCASATAAARLLKADPKAVSAGLLGYNGALVGCAFSAFLLQTPLALKAVATTLGGAASTLLASRLGALTAPVPQWTWAFNATALTTIACLRPFAGSAAAETAGAPTSFAALDPFDWVEGCLNGVAQIFVASNPVSGMLILLGIAFYSPWAAVAALLGSALGMLAAFVGGADAEEARAGIWGFNPALTALSVSIFFVPLGMQYQALVCGGALATVVAFAALKAAIWGTLQAPCMTLPFCAVASGCFLLGGRAPGLVRARAPHSPEANLRAYTTAS